jgi:hypothetical protein
MQQLAKAFIFQASSVINALGTQGVELVMTEVFVCREETTSEPASKTLPALKEINAIPTSERVESPRSVKFFCAGDNSQKRIDSLLSHAYSLTDSLVYYQWFKTKTHIKGKKK